MELKEAIAHLDDILHNKEWDCEECKSEHIQLREYLAELQEYRKAILNNTLIELPCKVGDTVYIISKVTSPIFSKNGNGIINGVTSETKLEIHKKPFYDDLLPLMGDLCFTTREEAEKALKERERESE